MISHSIKGNQQILEIRQIRCELFGQKLGKNGSRFQITIHFQLVSTSFIVLSTLSFAVFRMAERTDPYNSRAEAKRSELELELGLGLGLGLGLELELELELESLLGFESERKISFHHKNNKQILPIALSHDFFAIFSFTGSSSALYK